MYDEMCIKRVPTVYDTERGRPGAKGSMYNMRNGIARRSKSMQIRPLRSSQGSPIDVLDIRTGGSTGTCLQVEVSLYKN